LLWRSPCRQADPAGPVSEDSRISVLRPSWNAACAVGPTSNESDPAVANLPLHSIFRGNGVILWYALASAST